MDKVFFDEKTGCWIWTAAKNNHGYGQIGDGGKLHSAHRVSYELRHGTISFGACVLHRCDNPTCINPDHLFLGTQADNMADKVAKGRQVKGDKSGVRGTNHGCAKLTEEEVYEIRAAVGMSQRVLARKYHVTSYAIYAIRSGKLWKHLPALPECNHSTSA